jgi:CDP-diacylglycerol--glycerol-3-phosphate 3-phosphatidyltransferase
LPLAPDTNSRENAAMERIGKAAMLVVLGYTYLWTGLRAAVTTTVLSGIGWARLLAKRVHKRWKPELPALLVSFRAALGPGMIAVALLRGRGMMLGIAIALALLSDIFDGVLARRWGVDTERLRRWDTRVDIFFYLCVLIVVLLLFPTAIYRRWLLLAAVITAELIQQVFAAVKYGRHASYHSILAKIWGLLLAAAAIALLGFGINEDNRLLDLALGWGILCNLQGLIMTLVLPAWHRDVPSIFYALRLRRQTRLEPCSLAPSRAWW